MLKLYQRAGGSSEIVLGDRVDPEVWKRAREGTARVLNRRFRSEAKDLLLYTPFELWAGTNGFGDEFHVLHAEVPLARYLELSDVEENSKTTTWCRQIASALEELGHPVRFIAATLDEGGGPEAVPAPTPTIASDVLERALAEVERALAEGRPAVAVDRVHTALHAHLLSVAETAQLSPAPDARITGLFKLIRQSLPALQPVGPQAEEITRIMYAMATIVDTLNPLRNRASLAHPPEESLLPDAEAMLVINAVRTLFHYLDKRLARP